MSREYRESDDMNILAEIEDSPSLNGCKGGDENAPGATAHERSGRAPENGTRIDSEMIGSFETYKNNHSDVQKDDVIAELIPEQISECAIYLGRQPGEPCARDEMLQKVGKLVGSNANATGRQIMDTARQKLQCSDETCVLTKLAPELGYNAVDQEIAITMKIQGPTGSALLSNFNCDETLRQWSQGKYSDFFPYNFNMLDYAEHSLRDGRLVDAPDTLATISFKDLYTGKGQYRCAGCIINSDRYSGRGKHWMALFADARGGQKTKRFTVEFFNSSGNSPAPQWINWLVKTAAYMQEIIDSDPKLRGWKVEIIKVCDIRHQQSRSECGLYSLFYIWARLNGIPPEYFNRTPIPDQLMFEFRQHLFKDPTRAAVKTFDFDNYKKTVNIEWEES